ncbi:4'-phosphopantetheinyl transferase family protein [Brevibacillus sp. SYSU BS000544]|uniref:4'-phosphopantetheinyl transferase family protein n=1 Tax=Brevibacillus sp. SYSU BS000544 TaxID=3416443 RepID=UPI003CE4AE92
MSTDYSLAYCQVVQIIDAYRYLTEQELALLGNKATQKRMDDFVAGRIAAKQAIRTYLSLADHVVPSIFRNEMGEEAGKPFVHLDEGAALSLPSDSSLHVSITHADQKAYAAVSRIRIGIDNVTIEPYSNAFIAEVFHKEELYRWAEWLGVEHTHPLAICSGFAAKEAFLKWMGVGLRQALPMLQIIPLRHRQPDQKIGFFQQQFQAVCRITKDNSGQSKQWILDGYFSIESGQVIIMLLGE